MNKILSPSHAMALACLALCLLNLGCAHTAPIPQRYGMVIGLRPEKIEEYKRLHAAAWPGVLKKIHEANIRKYSIYLKKVDPDHYYLFSYFEYVGKDYKADMAKIAADPTTKQWWKETDPCQIPIPNRTEGEWWSNMEEVFHTE